MQNPTFGSKTKNRLKNKITFLAVIGLAVAIQAAPSWAQEPKSSAQGKPIEQKGPDKSDEKNGEKQKNFFQRLADEVLPGDAPYQWAPSTPMKLKLHRPEQFGVHLHNVEFRFSDQPGLDTPAGKSRVQFLTPTSELEFSGSILPKLLFAQVVIEPRDLLGKGLGDSLAKNIDPKNEPSGIVRDAFFDFLVDEALVVRLGQQRIPFGIEAQNPGGLLPFINRAFIDTKIAHNAGQQNTAFGDAELIQERDIGIQTRGTLSPYFNYAVGAFNGSGINVNDTNDEKDFVGRIGFVPHPGIRFGVSGYKGTATNLLKQNVSRDRAGVDVEVLPEFLPRVRLMAEAVAGNDGPFERNAWYASAFYALIPQRSPTSPGLWLSARYDEMRDDNRFTRTTLGLTYYILNAVNPVSGYWQQIKFQLNYEIRDHRGGVDTDALAKDLLLAQMTVRY